MSRRSVCRAGGVLTNCEGEIGMFGVCGCGAEGLIDGAMSRLDDHARWMAAETRVKALEGVLQDLLDHQHDYPTDRDPAREWRGVFAKAREVLRERHDGKENA